MIRQPSRRAAIAGIAVLVAASSAAAQSATERALEDFGRYLDAGLHLFGEFALGVRNADASALRSSANREQLDQMLQYLTQLRGMRRTLVDDLNEYVAAAHAGGDVSTQWQSAMRQADRVSDFIERCNQVIERTPALSLALTSAQRAELSETFAVRTQLLERLTSLPAPRSDAELNQVQSLATRYQAWSNAANEVRVALQEKLQA